MNGEQQVEEVVIVGAGITGLATALGLKRLGIRTVVLERSNGLRSEGAGIGLLPNAWRALDALGVADRLYPYYSKFQSVRTHVKDLVSGITRERSYNISDRRDGARFPVAVPRKALLETLAEELPVDCIRFSSEVVSIRSDVLQDSSTITIIHLEDDTVLRAKILIGCDGVHSVVAQWLGLSTPIVSGRSAIQGLTTMSDGHGYQRNIYHFLKNDKRSAIFPITDKMVVWIFLHKSIPNEKEIARDPEMIKRELVDNLAKDFPPEFLKVVRLTDTSTMKWAPLMFRNPWDVIFGPTCKGNVVVAGDAMHPMTPELSQGGSSSLEDAVILARCIYNNSDTSEGIKKYIYERRWHMAGIITGAYITGWMQLTSNWAVKWFRDNIFFRIIYPKMIHALDNDCGILPNNQ